MQKIIASLFIFAFGFVFVGNANAALEIKNNGANSTNKIKVKSTSSSLVTQTNSALIVNEIAATTNSGGNKANKNTGGSVTVASGNATTTVGVSNTANANTLSQGECGCGCCTNIGNWDVAISGNGADSWNKVKIWENCSHTSVQANGADFYNGILAVTQAGGNSANKNTGGDVEVTNGDSTTAIVVENTANVNAQ